MQIGKATYIMTLTEQDMKDAIEYWTKHVYNTNIKIKHLQHLVGERTEGCGSMEIDVPYQEGVRITVE